MIWHTDQTAHPASKQLYFEQALCASQWLYEGKLGDRRSEGGGRMVEGAGQHGADGANINLNLISYQRCEFECPVEPIKLACFGFLASSYRSSSTGVSLIGFPYNPA